MNFCLLTFPHGSHLFSENERKYIQVKEQHEEKLFESISGFSFDFALHFAIFVG